ncbi:OTU domain-containing protein 4 isoform X2 [Tiliqua scincoides]|uniref:OTU domain-containing protein 4 isoform X2 n=1 Tax=Tiliqua scincoides TaxID=71010 RepID=UPI0034638348
MEGGGEQQRQPPLSPGGGAKPPADCAMDSYLRSQGLHRKRVAKDGSCLFRAVAEQVFHSQAQHIAIRMACINYLRKNREKFEEFIEGSFEDYLKSLENPQEWVGQVEISALSLMYKKDFIIYQEPNSAPSHVTENGFHDKVLLCFSNGSHYDIIYPVEYTLRAALCQSILYELLYEKVFDVEVSKVLERLNSPDMTEDGDQNSDISDSEDEDLESEASATSDINGLKPKLFKNGNPTSTTLPSKVLRSLNPSVYQNIEYEVWQQSKREQQRQDFSIAAGMQYSVGDKCQVRLDHNGKFYNAHIQEVQSANGPIIVFVEELGAKHSVLLKNLKPLPQGSPMGSWNTVPGKKMKRPVLHGQNVPTDADCRGSKNPNKPTKPLPPRLQGPKQHHLPASGMQSQQTSPEQRTLGRNPSPAVRKVDRERTEDLDCASRDCNYFGHSPEAQREKQAREETHSLDEIHFWDEDAFPALSNPSVSQAATQTPDNCGRRKPLVSNGRRNSSLKEEKERENVDAKEEKECNPRQIFQVQKPEPKMSENNGEEVIDPGVSPPSNGDVQSQSVEENLQEHTTGVNSTPPSDFPEMHLPPTVPSIPAIVPAWPSGPTTYGPTGVPPQIPVSSVMSTSIPGLDSSLSQTQVTSSPVPGIPVSLQAVNQPLMHMPQTLNPYQDPLYPGFPLNEKGERVITPPYSLCSTGEDLPNDKNILRFFFNLGVKAYSCPMWAPHSYLYPLHQACLTACRMYPKVPVPVYSHNPWLQEVPLTQNGNDAAQTEGHFSMQNEVRMNGQSPQTDTMSPAMPLFIPTAQVPESQGLLCIEPETPPQALHAEYDESLGGKSLFPQPPFGQNPFLGPVPVAPIFPPLWYGYPVQGYVENSIARQVAVSAEDKNGDGYLPKEHSSPVPEAGCVESLQKAKQDSSSQDISPPVTTAKSECNVLNKTSTRVPREKQSCTAALSPTPAKPVLQNPSTETQGVKRQTESAVVTGVPETEMKSVPLSHKEKTDKVGAAGNVSTGLGERRVQRPREESSEDECEVSDMLRSGRSKQFYNQTYGGGRRPRSDWSYPPGRGGYHYPRNEEYWKGPPPPTRNRDESYHHHRSYRGRPYRNERRRANLGNGQRGPQL